MGPLPTDELTEVMTLQPIRPVLVLGATGRTGRRVTSQLLRRAVPVRAASRQASPAFEWDDPATWPAVLAGTGAAYVCYSPDLAVPGAADVVGAFSEQAVAQGVGRLVLLSGRGEPGAQAAESALRSTAEACGVAWTVVRSAWFAQNFSESFLLDQVLEGVVALPVGDIAEPFVDVEDVTDVIVALVDPGHSGRLYDVTGPRLLTFAQAVTEIAVATGWPVSFRSISAAEHTAALAADGLSEDLLTLMHQLFTEVLDGRNAHLTEGVQQALGHPARDFGDYVVRTARAGGWAVPAAAAR